MEDEEEETMLMLWNVLQLIDKGPSRKHWVHPLNQTRNIEGFLQELRSDTAKFHNYLRMKISTFDYVLDLIKPKVERQNTTFRKVVTAEERLLITLR